MATRLTLSSPVGTLGVIPDTVGIGDEVVLKIKLKATVSQLTKTLADEQNDQATLDVKSTEIDEVEVEAAPQPTPV